MHRSGVRQTVQAVSTSNIPVHDVRQYFWVASREDLLKVQGDDLSCTRIVWKNSGDSCAASQMSGNVRLEVCECLQYAAGLQAHCEGCHLATSGGPRRKC